MSPAYRSGTISRHAERLYQQSRVANSPQARELDGLRDVLHQFGKLELVCCCRTEPETLPYCHADEVRLLLRVTAGPPGQRNPLLSSISEKVRNALAAEMPASATSPGWSCDSAATEDAMTGSKRNHPALDGLALKCPRTSETVK
ncbi:unnamed protein product [Polarella glacialis]|nr:unnamed protein product [Polarella glacialis]